MDASEKLREADADFARRAYAEAHAKYRDAATRAEAESNRRVRVEALAQVARCFSLDGKLEEGRPLLKEAEALASTGEPLGWSRLLGVRGIFERESGDKSKAKATFEEMHRYCVEKNLHRRALDATHHIALVVPPEEQPAWGLKGIASAEALGDEGWLAVLWNNLGAAYEGLKQYDSMIGAYLKAREYHHRTGGSLQKLVADWAVGHGYRLMGRDSDAKEWLERALPQAVELHAKEGRPDLMEWVGWCRKDLGEVFAATGDKARGLALLRDARSALVESGIATWAPDDLAKLDEAIGRLL